MEVKIGKIAAEEYAEAAGHLLAELNMVRDDWKHGRITDHQLQERVRSIRRRARSGDSGYLRAMERIKHNWTATMHAAQEVQLDLQLTA